MTKICNYIEYVQFHLHNCSCYPPNFFSVVFKFLIFDWKCGRRCWKSCLYLLRNVCFLWNPRPLSWLNSDDDKLWLVPAMFYKLPLKYEVFRRHWSCFTFERFFSNLTSMMILSNLCWFCDKHYGATFEQILNYWSTCASMFQWELAGVCLGRRAEETSDFHECMKPTSSMKPG